MAGSPGSDSTGGVSWRRWMMRAGVDRAVLYSVLSVGVRALAGPLTAFLIAIRFSPPLQGYFYTFSSVVALQVLVELGLGQVILQFASHESARLQVGERGALSGDPAALSRLYSLGRLAFRWYAMGRLLVAAGLGVVGALLFSNRPEAQSAWEGPWVALCVITALRLPLLAGWALLEGCNQVASVNAYRLGEGVLISLATWAAILLGGGLWTAPVGAATGLMFALLFLGLRYRRFFSDLIAAPRDERVDWRNEMWPLQWRIALSWMAGYLMFSLFTPVLFHTQGSALAGQMGMTLSFVGAVSAVSSAWISTRAPTFGALIAGGRYAELDRLFVRLTIVSTGVAVLGAAAVWGGVLLLSRSGHPLALRVLPPAPTALFLAATVLVQVTVPQSAYLRAHKKEPFMLLSVVSGLLIAISTVILGTRFGAMGMASGYLAVAGLVVLPGGTMVWVRCRREWHASPAA